jgi:hypothetical protein
MKTYIGVKIVQAEPEIKDGIEGFKVVYEEGCVSWCSKDTFKKYNQEITNGTSFGLALEAVRQGDKISRVAWNNKDRYITRDLDDSFVYIDDILNNDWIIID